MVLLSVLIYYDDYHRLDNDDNINDSKEVT